ncbi:hypothetical protein, partial [Staphylococcus pasteuri]|uniref:hypothetical protein n=1 Tax=Staphylococcus pasteuri TaxID=45972 RepID=UPI0012B822B2
MKLELERKYEGYELLKWGSKGFENYNGVGGASGMVDEVKLEYLGNVVDVGEVEGEESGLRDRLVGSDCDRRMIKGIGVLG